MAKIALNKKMDQETIGPAVKEEDVETLSLKRCIVWIGNMDYEEDGKNVYGKLRDVVLEVN